MGRKLLAWTMIFAMGALIGIGPAPVAQANESAETEAAAAAFESDKSHEHHRRGRAMRGVMKGGVFLDRASLDELVQDLAEETGLSEEALRERITEVGTTLRRMGKGRHGHGHPTGFPGIFGPRSQRGAEAISPDLMTPELEAALSRWEDARKQAAVTGRDAVRAWRKALAARIDVVEAWAEAARDAEKITQDQHERIQARLQRWREAMESHRHRFANDET